MAVISHNFPETGATKISGNGFMTVTSLNRVEHVHPYPNEEEFLVDSLHKVLTKRGPAPHRTSHLDAGVVHL
jgi:hypothetical protein